jgi:hypothetical protein
MKMRFDVAEIFKIAEWLESKGLHDNRNAELFISREETGIAATLEVRVTTGDGEGIWADLSDYENW